MIGFITDEKTASAVLAGIEETFSDHGQPPYWTTGSFPVYSGEHTGNTFIPASDQVLNTPLRRGLTPMDYPETHKTIEALGGLESRIDLDPEAIINPDQPKP